MLKSIFIFFVITKVLLQQLCSVISLVIARLKVISVNPTLTMYVNNLLVLRRKHSRNLIMINDLHSKIMHQNNTLKNTPAFFPYLMAIAFCIKERSTVIPVIRILLNSLSVISVAKPNPSINLMTFDIVGSRVLIISAKCCIFCSSGNLIRASGWKCNCFTVMRSIFFIIREQGVGVIPKIKQSHFIVIWLPR